MKEKVPVMPKKKKLPESKRIPVDQRMLAAKFFSISNMGQPEPKRLDQIERAYARLRDEIESEFDPSDEFAEEVDFDDEYRSWLKDANEGEPYITTEWNEKIYPKLTGEWAVEEKK